MKHSRWLVLAALMASVFWFTLAQGQEETSPQPWKEAIPPEIYKELVQRETKIINKAIETGDFNDAIKGKLAAMLIAGYTKNLKGEVGNPAGVRAAALQLAEILGEKDAANNAKKLASAIESFKGDASAKNQGLDFKQYIPNDYDLMVPYMTKKKGGDGLHPDLQFTRRLQGTQEFVENLFNYLARRAPKADDVKTMAKELELLGYKTATSATVMHTYAPRNKTSRRDPAVWYKTANDMRDSALALAEAAKKQDAEGIQKAADTLSRSCVECHKMFQ